MSQDRRDVTNDCMDLEDLARSTFDAGTRVCVEQVGLVHDRIGTHCMGFGELSAAPRVGGPLELRIRAARGLASSLVRELRVPAPGYLLVATERSVYLVALPDLENQAYPDAVENEAIAMLKALVQADEAGTDVTQYVRLAMDQDDERAALPRGPVFASVARAGDEENAEPLGQCELLAHVVPDAPLRIAAADGRVFATSDVVSVSPGESGEFRVETGNSVYVLAAIVPTSEG